MLYLVCYGDYCIMDLNNKELDFIDDILYPELEIMGVKDIEPMNTPQGENKLFLIVSDSGVINLAYLNDQMADSLKKLGFYVIEYDTIKIIDFYDWCKNHLEEIEWYLREKSKYRDILKKIF